MESLPQLPPGYEDLQELIHFYTANTFSEGSLGDIITDEAQEALKENNPQLAAELLRLARDEQRGTTQIGSHGHAW